MNADVGLHYVDDGMICVARATYIDSRWRSMVDDAYMSWPWLMAHGMAHGKKMASSCQSPECRQMSQLLPAGQRQTASLSARCRQARYARPAG